MRFIVSNCIRVTDPNSSVKEWCKQNLVIDNPEYIKKTRLGKWTGNVSREIFLYEKTGNELRIPFGCFKRIYMNYRSFPFEADFGSLERVLYNSGIKLYDYQENAVKEALRARNGIIVMPCGSGKTQTALELVNRIGGRCLWLTHTQDLLNQSKTRAEACFNLPYAEYGTITGGKVNIGKITFATVQTMCKLDLNQYRYAFDIIIVDECHKCVGSPTHVMQFYKVLSSLSCRYKFGLTATPRRADGLEKSMFALLGDIVVEVPKSAIEKNICPVEVRTFETGYMPDFDVVLSGDGTINYSSLIHDLISNEERFNFVLNIINIQYKAGPMLVLGNRVEYLEKLSKKFDGKCICLSGMGSSKRAKAERKEALLKLNDGELDCVFCTYQLAAEGLDVPNLRYVVFATPEKDPTRVQQASGRVGRKALGKDCGVVIDFVDAFGMYKGWWKKRLSVYKKLGYDI